VQEKTKISFYGSADAEKMREKCRRRQKYHSMVQQMLNNTPTSLGGGGANITTG
jgi:hypothetical protein